VVRQGHVATNEDHLFEIHGEAVAITAETPWAELGVGDGVYIAVANTPDDPLRA
jgi:hypothetical protein